MVKYFNSDSCGTVDRDDKFCGMVPLRILSILGHRCFVFLVATLNQSIRIGFTNEVSFDQILGFNDVNSDKTVIIAQSVSRKTVFVERVCGILPVIVILQQIFENVFWTPPQIIEEVCREQNFSRISTVQWEPLSLFQIVHLENISEIQRQCPERWVLSVLLTVKHFNEEFSAVSTIRDSELCFVVPLGLSSILDCFCFLHLFSMHHNSIWMSLLIWINFHQILRFDEINSCNTIRKIIR